MDITSHKLWLENHIKAKIAQCERDPGPLLIKQAHTSRVLENAESIATGENFGPEPKRATLIAALYHDLSRFDQYLRYGTFKDKDSRNHGSWSVKLVREHRRLESEPVQIRRLVHIAVGLHNRLALPARLSECEFIVSSAVRDADKLDILRVMDEHLGSGKPYNPTIVLGLPDSDLVSEKVLEDAFAGRSASYSDLRSVNDFRLLLGTWYFGLNFETSRSLFRAKGHAKRLVSALPQNPAYGEIRSRILELIAPA